MVDDPLGVPIEERRGRVDVHWCALDQRLVTFLWILLRGVSEETRGDRPTDTVEVLTRGYDIVFIAT